MLVDNTPARFRFRQGGMYDQVARDERGALSYRETLLIWGASSSVCSSVTGHSMGPKGSGAPASEVGVHTLDKIAPPVMRRSSWRTMVAFELQKLITLPGTVHRLFCYVRPHWRLSPVSKRLWFYTYLINWPGWLYFQIQIFLLANVNQKGWKCSSVVKPPLAWMSWVHP